MFPKKSETKPSPLEMELDRLLARMKDTDPTLDDYATTADQYVKLHKVQESESSRRRVSADTLATIAANVLGIGLVLGYEHAHVVTSKALGFVLKSR